MIDFKKFTLFQVLSFILITIILIFSNIKFDTYGIFTDRLLPSPLFNMKNLRINKYNYLEKNYNNYDSYLIGGSRALTFKESELNRYTGYKFFNYSGIRSDMYDNLITIKYLLKKQKVKMIILQLGMDDLYNYGENNENILIRSHYELLNENKYVYYFKYIFGFDLKKIINDELIFTYLKLDKEITIQDEFLLYSLYEEQIKINPTKFFTAQFSIGAYLLLPKFNKPKINENINALKEIKKITDENGTKLLVITTPLNHLMYHKIKQNDLNLFLKQLEGTINFWNFTTLNSITLDNTNYYDHSHYRYSIASMILAKIFKDDSIKVPDDFGIYIEKFKN